MFENYTESVLKQNINNNITNNVDKSEGSFTNDITSAVSVTLAQGYVNADAILQLIFAQTSAGEYLTKRAAEFGVYRKTGTKATGTVTFTGNNGVVIPVGTIVQTTSLLRYKTTEAKTIASETAIINIEAENVGIIYNVPANVIIQLPVAIVGVNSITNINPLNNGVDVENDENLKQRLQLQVQMPSTSGNANDYKKWALEVTNVGDAKVFPLWNGAGTVKVVIINAEKQPADATTINNVAAYIESVRPIGANVTVTSATSITINVSCTVTLANGYTSAAVLANVQNSITNYLKSIAFKQTYVSYAAMGSLILGTEGVLDYSNYLINNGASNVSIGDTEVPFMGTVTIL